MIATTLWSKKSVFDLHCREMIRKPRLPDYMSICLRREEVHLVMGVLNSPGKAENPENNFWNTKNLQKEELLNCFENPKNGGSGCQSVGQSLLSASMGSMFEARHAGYRPDATQTTIPMIIPSGT